MLNLRRKLLIPTVLMTLLSVLGIAYISILQYNSFRREAENQIAGDKHKLYMLIGDLEKQTQNLIESLSNNWHFMDILSAGNMDLLLNELIPFHEGLGYDFVAVYDMEGITIARGDAPGRFGKSDDLYQHIMKAKKGQASRSIVTMYEGKLLLLELKRLETAHRPIGVLAAGQYLDDKMVNEFAQLHQANLVLQYNSTVVVSSNNAQTTENSDQEQIRIEFVDEFGQECPLSAILSKDLSKIKSAFWQNLCIVIFAIVLLSGIVIYLSRQIVTKTVNALEKARASAEKELIERKRAEEELKRLNEKLEQRVQERTRNLQDKVMERKLAEEALRESQERLKSANLDLEATNRNLEESIGRVNKMVAEAEFARVELGQIFRAAGDGIRVVDTDFNVLRINEEFARLSGKPETESVGKKCYDGFPGSGCHTSRCPLSRIVGGAERVEFEVEKERSDGTRVPCLATATAFRAPDGEMIGIVEDFKDITQRKQAEGERRKLEAQLQQAERMEAIGTLAGGIAHDFNNLLMGIQGNVSLMSFETDSEHPHYDMLKTIEGQVRSGATLTRQLLGYARKGQYDVKSVNLNKLVQETSETFGRTRRQITIHREFAEDLFAIEADQGQIEQIILNLCVNASDAMPGGGDLTIKTTNVTDQDMKDKPYDAKPGNYVLLTVTDTGMGMDKETQARIFDPFFTTKDMASGRGTGLGLASAYGIVKVHAGYIDVESEKGKGTTLSIYLPTTEKKAGRTVEVAEQAIKGAGTVLLVDDEEVVLEVGTKLLEKLGYAVMDAESGRKALERYKDNRDKIDIVILDMVMPDVGGGEAYDKMKEINPNVKVLLSSGYSIEDTGAKEIMNRGCDGFIQKPFNMEQLSQSIQRILGNE